MKGAHSAPSQVRRLFGRTALYVILMVVASIGSLLARGNELLWIGASPVDAGLYIRLGASLYQGHWLGVYNQRTLGRDPGYPMFIALSRWLDLPLQVTEQLTFLLAALAVAACVKVTTRRTGLAVLVYVVLAFVPVNFGSAAAEVVRDGWYASLSLLVIAMWFLVVYLAVAGWRFWWVAPTAVAAGVATVAFWLCREEGPWVLPALGVIAIGLPALAAARWWFSPGRTPVNYRQGLLVAARVVGAVLIIGVTAYVPMEVLKSVNKNHYGVALINDNAGGQFRRAEADWTRVRSGPLRRDYPIDRSQREAVYRVSPAAAELEPILESPTYVWNEISCPKGSPASCDLYGAFTVWAVRDAAARAGHYQSAAGAEAYWGQVASQIEAACRTKALTCARKLPAFLQPLEQTSPHLILNAMGTLFHQAVTSNAFTSLPITPIVLPGNEAADVRSVLKGYPATYAGAVAKVKSFESSDAPYRALADVFHVLFPVGLVLAGLGTILGAVRPASRYRGLWLLCLVLAVGVFFRLMVLGLEATTEAPTTEARYGLVVQDLLIAFAVLGTLQLGLVIRDEVARRKGRSGSQAVPGNDPSPPDGEDRTGELAPIGAPNGAEGATLGLPRGSVLSFGGPSDGAAAVDTS